MSWSLPEGTVFETLYNSIMMKRKIQTLIRSATTGSGWRCVDKKGFLWSVIFLTIVCSVACGDKAASNESLGPRLNSSAAESPPGASASPVASLPKIVAFGDSLTAGYNLPAGESYPALLQRRLEMDGYKYEVVNAGVSGDTSSGGLRRIDWALDGDVRIVILELGANVILRGQSIKAMKENLSQIIERARAHGAEVLLAGMYAPTNSGFDYQKEVVEAYRDLARKYEVAFIPFFLDRVAGIESLNLSDGVHPNAEGTKIVAETVYQAVRPMLEKQKQRDAPKT